MERVAIVVRLKEGSGPRAAELIAGGPPFDLAETGIVRHSVYLSAGEVVFVFEGHQVEWMVDGLIDDPFQHKLHSALEQWRAIVDGTPRIARERFDWESREFASAVTAVERPVTLLAGRAR
jgi:hypothetical protein